MDDYLTLQQLQAKLQVSRATVYRLLAQGLPSIKVGAARRFAWPAVVAWLQGQTSHTRKTVQAKPVEPVYLTPGSYYCQDCGRVSRLTRPMRREHAGCGYCGGPAVVRVETR